jgi:hypothetical protein
MCAYQRRIIEMTTAPAKYSTRQIGRVDGPWIPLRSDEVEVVELAVVIEPSRSERGETGFHGEHVVACELAYQDRAGTSRWSPPGVPKLLPPTQKGCAERRPRGGHYVDVQGGRACRVGERAGWESTLTRPVGRSRRDFAPQPSPHGRVRLPANGRECRRAPVRRRRWLRSDACCLRRP